MYLTSHEWLETHELAPWKDVKMSGTQHSMADQVHLHNPVSKVALCGPPSLQGVKVQATATCWPIGWQG